jgi:hypothetical protein
MTEARVASSRVVATPFDDIAVDLKNASVFQLSVGLTEYDKPGQRYDTWPDVVKAIVERECKTWLERNPTSVVLAITTAVVPGSCVFCIHWRIRD